MGYREWEWGGQGYFSGGVSDGVGVVNDERFHTADVGVMRYRWINGIVL